MVGFFRCHVSFLGRRISVTPYSTVWGVKAEDDEFHPKNVLQQSLGSCSVCMLIRCMVCVCVSQTLFQREVNLCLESVHDVHAGGHRKPIELCPTKLSMVSSGCQG